MHLDPNPTYRKVIPPWYDSDPVCGLLLLFTAVIFLFGLAGISVARSTPQYNDYTWLPILLCALCLLAGISVLVRLVRRHATN